MAPVSPWVIGSILSTWARSASRESRSSGRGLAQEVVEGGGEPVEAAADVEGLQQLLPQERIRDDRRGNPVRHHSGDRRRSECAHNFGRSLALALEEPETGRFHAIGLG